MIKQSKTKVQTSVTLDSDLIADIKLIMEKENRSLSYILCDLAKTNPKLQERKK